MPPVRAGISHWQTASCRCARANSGGVSAAAVQSFRPDRLVICTLPEEQSAWLRYDVVDRAREANPGLPVTHVIVHAHAPVT
jgi:hypothetical protein